MLRRNIYVSQEQTDFLKTLTNINVSEHIRRAIDEYIQKLKTTNVSASASKQKGA